MKFRRARLGDLDRIVEIYDRIHLLESEGKSSTGWKKGIYPTRTTALEAINAGQMFIAEDKGIIVAAARIDQDQGEEYEGVKWDYQASKRDIMVIHTLVVDPRLTGKGYGREFMAFYEEYAFKNGASYLRMDTNFNNLVARKLYQNLGYKEVEVRSCTFNGIDETRLVFFEKKLSS